MIMVEEKGVVELTVKHVRIGGIARTLKNAHGMINIQCVRVGVVDQQDASFVKTVKLKKTVKI